MYTGIHVKYLLVLLDFNVQILMYIVIHVKYLLVPVSLVRF
jgi:hypothetical protein